MSDDREEWLKLEGKVGLSVQEDREKGSKQ